MKTNSPIRRLLGAITLLSVCLQSNGAELSNLSLSHGRSDYKTGFTIHSPGGAGHLGNPTSTLVFTGTGITHSLNFDLIDTKQYGDVAFKIHWTPNLSSGKLIDTDYYSDSGAKSAEQSYGARRRASGDSYTNRESPPLLFLQTRSPVDSDSHAFELIVESLASEKKSARSSISTYFGGRYEHTQMTAHSVIVLKDPYEYFTSSPPTDLPKYSNRDAIQLSTHFLSFSYSFHGITQVIQNLDFEYDFSFIPAGLGYAEDIHYLRTDLQKSPSVSFLGAMTGLDYRLALRYRIGRHFSTALQYSGSKYSTINGRATFHYADGGQGNSYLNQLFSKRSTSDINLNIAYNW